MHLSKIFLSLLLVVSWAGIYAQTNDSIVRVPYQPVRGVQVHGVVRDAATGKGIRGIRVTYKNYSAAITDSSGSFNLNVPTLNVSILMEGEGYQLKEVALNGKSNIAAGLYEEAFTSFYDMASLPLNTVMKNHIPHAVASVQTEGNWGRLIETPSTFLQGRVAGLNAIRRSGTVNSGASLFLRGMTSLYATNQPLIIVDGVVFDNADYGSIISNHYADPLSTIDPRDIDNISVIKDGSSIYGAKGANGVIIITTARAKELGTRIDLAVFGGINSTPERLPVLDAAQHRVYLSDILKSQGLTDAQIQAQPYMNDNNANPDYFRYHNTTDWQDVVMRNSNTKNIYLKVTGGDNIAKYALSLGYLNNGSLVDNTDLKRYNMRFNGDLNLNKRLSAITNLSFTFNEQNLRDQGSASKTNPIFLALIKSPLVRTKDVSDIGIESPTLAAKDTFNISNPVVITENGTGNSKGYRFLGSISFNYQVLKSVAILTTLGITYDKIRENFFVPRIGVTTDTLSNDIALSRSGSMVKSLFSLYNDSRLNFSKRFNNVHDLNASIGIRYLKSKAEQDLGLGYNSPVDQLVSVQFGSNSLRKIGGSIGEAAWLNTYFNADYNYSDKYFLSFNMAIDGSSRFGKEIENSLSLGDNKLGVFPSLAAAWLISSESFAQSNFLDVLKLRASVAIAGNDDIGNYNARRTYISQNFLGLQGLVRSGFGNEKLQWEQVRKLNLGVDVSLFNERLSMSIDAYNNKTDKMLVFETAAAVTGASSVLSNSGGMTTKGIEASLNARILNKTFKWDVGLRIGISDSKIDKLPVDRILNTFAGATYITRTSAVPNLFFGFKTNGVYSSDNIAAQEGLFIKNTNGSMVPFHGGDIRFIDLNGDHIIDDNDRQVIGDPNPDYFGGITSRFSYKRFSLDALFTFTHGNDIYNYTRNQLEAQSSYNNQTTAILNRWKTNGDQTNIPRATFGDPMGNSRFSDRWIEDGSYLRFRTATLSYEIPFKPGFLKYAVAYVTGNNIFTLTKYSGYDPEFSAAESIFAQGIDNTLEPQVRSLQFGLRIGL